MHEDVPAYIRSQSNKSLPSASFPLAYRQLAEVEDPSTLTVLRVTRDVGLSQALPGIDFGAPPKTKAGVAGDLLTVSSDTVF